MSTPNSANGLSFEVMYNSFWRPKLHNAAISCAQGLLESSKVTQCPRNQETTRQILLLGPVLQDPLLLSS